MNNVPHLIAFIYELINLIDKTIHKYSYTFTSRD